MTWKTKIFTFAMALATCVSNAQDTLTLQKLVEKTLNANFDVQIAQVQVQQSANLVSLGQAGFFPSVSIGGNAAYSNNNTNLEFAGGLPPVERNGAVNTSLGGNIGINYTLFNGLGRVYSYRRLQAQQSLTMVQAKLVSENAALEAINRFINAQQAKANAKLAKANHEISKERLKYSRKAYTSGANSKIDLLSAEIDAINDSLLMVQAQSAYNKEIFALNVSLGNQPESACLISTNVPVPVLESSDDLLKKVTENNTAIVIADLNKKLTENQLKLSKSQQLPSLSMNAGYGFQSSQNGAGIILAQNTLGVNTGLNLSMPIFNGNQLSNAIKNATLDVQKSSFEKEKASLQAKQLLLEALQDQTVLEVQIINLKKSLQLADQALNRSKIAYQGGQLRFVELRAAQTNKLQAETGLLNAQMNLIRIRYSIKRLMGELI
jgi:outer membrane protein